MKKSRVIFVLWLAISLAVPLGATETAFWQVGTFNELLQGTLEGVSLTKDGELKLAPEARAFFSPDETMALSIVGDRQHNLYLGTGQQGKVFRVGPNGKGSLCFTAQEPQIFALSLGPDGALYVGSSPEGKIYRVTPDGQSKVFFDPKAKYIWALAFDAQGRLYAGTGDRGLIYRIDPSGKGAVFFDSKQTHIMCLTLDLSGNVIAGSVPNGLVYRVTPQGKAFVIYQASLPEIHDLATDSQGRIYAAALGGAGGQAAPGLWGPPGPANVTPATTTVTVEASADDAKTEADKTQTSPPKTVVTPNFSHPTPAPSGFPVPTGGQGRGMLIQILPDNSTETLWTSNNESIFGLAVRNDKVLFSTDSNGRIFELTPSRDSQDLTLLTETHESLATRLLFQGNDLYATTSNIAKLVQVSAEPAHEGNYVSPVKDTKFFSHWGVLAWRGEAPQGASIEFFTRSGNSDRPDQTWSDWAGPYQDSDGSPIQSPAARYIQWKAVFHTTGTSSPTLDDATVSYLNQNLPPQIRSLNVSTAGERTGPGGSSFPGASPGGTVTVSAGTSMSFSPPSSPSGGGKTPTTLTWQADDPNGDQLVYALYVKSDDEQEWHLVKDKLHQTAYTLEPQALPDGKYSARLVASDEESNPASAARKAELLSAPFWIDNTPPEIKVLKQTTTGDDAEIQFRAEDATSPLRAAETTTDSTDWLDIYSDDGVVDSRVETFTVRVHNLASGERIVALRVSDTAGNVGVGKAVIRISAGARSQH